MASQSNSANIYIPRLPAVLAKKEDTKCFASFSHKLRPAPFGDAVVCAAPPPEWYDKYVTLHKTTKIKIQNQ